MAEQIMTWGPIKVTAAAEIRGSKILLITSARETVQIRVTPSGLIRVDEVKKRKQPVNPRRPTCLSCNGEGFMTQIGLRRTDDIVEGCGVCRGKGYIGD